MDSSATTPRIPARTRLIPAMARGFVNRCPHCAEDKVFGRFLKVRPECEVCGLEMHHHRADDLPPYLVIFLVGHIVGYLILEIEMGYDLPLWVSLTLWPGLTLGLALALLQPVKGAVVGLQYAFGMHGFNKLPRSAENAGSGMPRDGTQRDGTQHGPADTAPAHRLGSL